MLSIGANSFTDSGLSSDFSSAQDSILSVFRENFASGQSRTIYEFEPRSEFDDFLIETLTL